MSVVALSHNITRLETFEGSPGGTFGTVGGGPGAAAEAGLHYEGSQCAARRIGATSAERGFTYTDTATTDLTAAGNEIIFAKVMTALSAVITSGGTRVGWGNTTSAYYNYQVGDDGSLGDGQFALPARGGYVITPIEVRKSAWHNLARVGSPDLTIVDVYRLTHNVSATTGAGTSQALDSVDVTADGLFLVGGIASDPDGTFQDFVDADEGGGLSGAERVGIWTSQGNAKFAYMPNIIGRTSAGTVTATVFTDSFFNVIFPGGFVGSGVNGLEFDLGNVSTVVTLSNGTIAGEGRARRKEYFSTYLDVSSGSDTIGVSDFSAGDQLIYSAEGGTEDIGPDATSGEAEDATSSGVATTSDRWYATASTGVSISLSSTAADSLLASPTLENLTASSAANEENHSLTRDPDTRPDITGVGTSGSAVWTNVTLNRCREIDLTSSFTLNSCNIVACEGLTIDTGATNIGGLVDCNITSPTTGIGEPFLSADIVARLKRVTGCTFSANTDSRSGGHAIEVTFDGTVSQNTTDLTDLSYVDYFATDGDNTGGWGFNASTDVDTGTDVITITGHSFTNADPVYYSDEGGTVISGLTDQGLYYVRSVSVDTITLHRTSAGAAADINALNITSGTSETHKLYSANAAFFNNTGGDVILNVSGGNTPTVRNSAGSTTTVNNAVTLRVEGITAATQVAMFADGNTGPFADGTELMNQMSTSTIAQTTLNYTADQPVRVVVRNSGAILYAGYTDVSGPTTVNETDNARRRDTGVVNLIPPSGATGDIYTFSGAAQFSELTFDVTTAGAGTYTLAWEYWNGAWTSLSVEMSSVDFKTAGSCETVSFTPPTDWSGAGGFLVRYTVQAGTITTSPLANVITLDAPKYVAHNTTGVVGSTGLTVTAVWQLDPNA